MQSKRMVDLSTLREYIKFVKEEKVSKLLVWSHQTSNHDCGWLAISYGETRLNLLLAFGRAKPTGTCNIML